MLLAAVFVAAVPAWLARARPLEPLPDVAPVAALRAAKQAHLTGPVLNAYSLGGYLIYSGIPVFIDGRSDLYRDAFIKSYLEALGLATPDALDKLLDKYRVTWTLLAPSTPAVAMLDRMGGWRRVYADKVAVVHARIAGPSPLPESKP
jgi:hypothetical protein